MKARQSLALAAVAAVLLAACQSGPPKPPPCKVCAYGGPGAPPGVALPPGLATPFKAGERVAVAKAVDLRSAPSPTGETVEALPAGTVVTLRSRMLNAIGPWWLVDHQLNSGWLRESELPAPR